MLTLTLRGLFGARRKETGRSAFLPTRPAAGDRRPLDADLIYRMKAWPQLPESGRTAEIYRMLSIMSSQPVNRQWLLDRFRMAPQQLDALLSQLVAEGAVEVIDPARFAGREPARA
jgi:hypothetical protein